MPAMLLFLIGFIRLWQFAEHFNVVQVDEFPAVQMSANCNVHVFHCCSFEPTAGLFQGFDPPDAGGSVEAEEVEEHSVDLLFDFEMET